MVSNRALAERIVKALALAESMPVEKWREGSADRVLIRGFIANGRLVGLEASFDAMVSFVEELLNGGGN